MIARALTVLALALALVAPPARADEERPLRLLTWNVGTCLPWAMRLPDGAIPRVAGVIAGARPDVVTLEEVHDPGQITTLRLALAARGLRYRMTFVAVDPAHPDGLAVVLHRVRGATLRQLRTSVAFVSPGADLGGVTVLAVHAPTGAPAERAAYARELLAWAGKQAGAVVAAGDWNLGPHGGCGLAAVLPALRRQDQATYRRLVAGSAAHTSVGPTTMYGLAFDHVFVRGGRIVSQRVVRGQRVLSMDHDPLVVDLALRASASRGLTGAVGSTGR